MRTKKTKGPITAQKLLNDCGLNEVLEISLENLIFGRNAVVKEENISGAEGRIVFQENNAVITVHSEINIKGKKRFVLAHELGHYEMHKDLLTVHADDHKSLSDWYKNGRHEIEANQFAAELLMPKELFIQKSKGKDFNLDLIEYLSNRFQTTKTSTLIRYSKFGDFPIALIFSEEGIVKWTQITEDFVLQYIPLNEKVPVNTVAYDFFKGRGLLSEPEKIRATDWFSDDFEISKFKNWEFYEQCFQVSKNGILSCVWGY